MIVRVHLTYQTFRDYPGAIFRVSDGSLRVDVPCVPGLPDHDTAYFPRGNWLYVEMVNE